MASLGQGEGDDADFSVSEGQNIIRHIPHDTGIIGQDTGVIGRIKINHHHWKSLG